MTHVRLCTFENRSVFFLDLPWLFIPQSCFITNIKWLFFITVLLNTASGRLLLNKTARDFLRGSFRTYSVYMTWHKDTQNAHNGPWVREIFFNLIRHNVWYKIHLRAPHFDHLFPTETDGRTDRHAVLLDTIHEAQICVHVTAE